MAPSPLSSQPLLLQLLRFILLIPSEVFFSLTTVSTAQEEHVHSLSPTPRQTPRCQMKLNTNIPKWLSHRAGLFGSTGSAPSPLHLSKEARGQKRSRGVPQQKPNSKGVTSDGPGALAHLCSQGGGCWGQGLGDPVLGVHPRLISRDT